MSGKLLDNANKRVLDMMKGTSSKLKEMQSTPIGTEARSPQEKRKIWDAIMAIPDKQTRNNVMMEMASMAGHKGESFDSCDWCKFVREHVGR